MTRLVARIILAVLVLPISNVLQMFLSSAVAFASNQQSVLISTGAALGVLVFVVTYWLLLWRSSVQWTPSRIRRTWLIVVLAMAFGALVLGFFAAISSMPVPFAATLAGYTMPVAWILGTVFVWRETPKERMERLKTYGTDAVCCPMCGYNMTGLKETRCPECGAQFTVDELYTAQHEREQELQRS
ncbi:MAG: DUF1345 domain-containing protein [Planctomycetes bacterium]|nr:DUF1345 domain-containing protein [Planctomycetota bacterium]